LKVDALIMAGGKGSRMGFDTIEKPMQMIGGKHVVERVVDAIRRSKYVNDVLVSVSSNTPKTEEFVRDELGVDVICTTGIDFMNDMHMAFEYLDEDYVLTCPSDLPLLKTFVVDQFIEYFKPEMQSAIAVVDKDTVVGTGITPSFTIDIDGKPWVLSSLCISDRRKTLDGVYLQEQYLKTDWVELAINVNTQHELALSRGYFE
jgi:adenosylcobinamide-phosphate guanylyltransferase